MAEEELGAAASSGLRRGEGEGVGSGALKGQPGRGPGPALRLLLPPVPGAEVGAEAESCNPAGSGPRRGARPAVGRGAGDARLGPRRGRGRGTDPRLPPSFVSGKSEPGAPPSPIGGEKLLALSGRCGGARRGRRGGQVGCGRWALAAPRDRPGSPPTAGACAWGSHGVGQAGNVVASEFSSCLSPNKKGMTGMFI